MVSLSRTAGGSIITLSVLTLAVYFLLNGKVILAGIACGLAVLSGAGIWSALVPFTIALIIWMILNKGQLNIHSQELDTVKAVVREPSFKVAFVLSIAIIGTLWFILPRSLSALTGSITDYFHLLERTGDANFSTVLTPDVYLLSAWTDPWNLGRHQRILNRKIQARNIFMSSGSWWV